MDFRVRDIFAAGEQYHGRRAIQTHGVTAVINMRAQQLHAANPSSSYPLCHVQAGYEVAYLGCVAAGETPFKHVREALDGMTTQAPTRGVRHPTFLLTE